MTQACQRLKPRFRRHCKFLQSLSGICLKVAKSGSPKMVYHATVAVYLAAVCNGLFSNHDNLSKNLQNKSGLHPDTRNDAPECIQYRLLTH